MVVRKHCVLLDWLNELLVKPENVIFPYYWSFNGIEYTIQIIVGRTDFSDQLEKIIQQ